MIKTLVVASVFLVFSSQAYSSQPVRQYSVSITNLTKGQTMHHPLFVFHSEDFSLFELGYEASPGISMLATDADHRTLKREFRRNRMYIEKIAEARSVLTPGQTMKFNVQSKSKYMSIASMLATTNDGFTAGMLLLNLQRGQKNVSFLEVYDAGAEANNESCQYIPGPPCNSKYKFSETSEGFVRKHPGLYGTSDIDTRKYKFNSSRAAKITIKRIK